MRYAILVGAAVASAILQAHAGEPYHHQHHSSSQDKPVYVGNGRYTCHDSSANCARIQQNNRRQTQRQIDNAGMVDDSSTYDEVLPTMEGRHERNMDVLVPSWSD